DELKTAYPDIDYDGDDDLFAVLNDINSETKKKFVFIIDEWDCPFTEHEDDAEGHDDYLVFLTTLLKDQEYVALAYMTGIFPVSCLRTDVDLNMFTEFSMENPGYVKQYFGFTEAEVRTLCDERKFSYEALDDFYNGYSFEDGQGKDLRIFNPWSVDHAILNDQLMSYWPRTIGYEYLLRLLKDDVGGLHGLLLRLLNDEKDITVFDLFHGNVTAQRNRRDVLTTLMHTGYLTDDVEKGLRFPNLEIRRIFTDTIENIGTSHLSEYMNDSEKLVRAAEIDRDAEKVCELLKKIHNYYVSAVSNAVKQTLASYVKFAFVFARIDYRIETESPAGNGTYMLTFSPYQPSANPPILIELGSGTDGDARTRFAEHF
ncbi:MAG: AAA family ATPase, partial [Clostridia bacterium]|nr:AAA family ATPase [Clostridia bacterium]